MKVKENGMSLIALVVTIIVLILLGGVTISNIRNDSGLFNKSLFNGQQHKLLQTIAIKQGK